MGVVRLSNSAFWGPCNQIAKIDDVALWASVIAHSWNGEASKKIARVLQVNSGSLIVSGCEFRKPLKHIVLGQNVERAVITGNPFAGPAQIENASRNNVRIGRTPRARRKATAQRSPVPKWVRLPG